MTEQDDHPDQFVPDPKARSEFGLSAMGWWRWNQDALLIELGLPPPIVIRGKNYRSRRALEAFKQRLLRRAIAARKETVVEAT
jgi:hypothetical protein